MTSKGERGVPRITSYTTTAGTVVPILPVATQYLGLISQAVEREFRARAEPLDPPTYVSDAETVTGEKLSYPHTEETLETDDPEETARNRAAWAAHQDALARKNTVLIERTMEYLLLEGVALDVPEDETWIKRARRWGLEIPEDPDDLKVLYLTTQVMRTPEDIKEIARAIMALSIRGTDPAKVAAVEALFRSNA